MNRYSSHLDWIGSRRKEMVKLLTRWANTNSGSGNLPGLERMRVLIEPEFADLGCRVETVELQPKELIQSVGERILQPLGKAIRAIRRVPGVPRVFLCIHMDTVYARDHSFQQCVQLDENRMQGPGVADAKGGLVVLLTALQALNRSPWAESVSWEALVTPDEEIGSPGSAPLLQEAAGRNDFGLVFEPALPDGSLVGPRKGSGNFSVLFHGKSAHAGRSPEKGRNAINAMAGFIVRLNELSDEDGRVIINVGMVRGGGPVNIVPDLAECRFNVRVTRADAQAAFEQGLAKLRRDIDETDGVSMELHGTFTRPPKPLEGKTMEFMDHVLACARDLGLSLQWNPSGGASEGNNLQAAGLPTVDSLGVRGGNLHSSEEYVYLDSLVERARLSALVLMKIATGEIRLMEG